MDNSIKPIDRVHKIPPEFSRNYNPEKVVTKNLLKGFVAKGSKGEKIIEEILGCPIKEISFCALITLSEILSDLAKVRLERNYKRKKDLIVKWFNDNEQTIKRYKPYIKIIYTKSKEQKEKKL